jgi:GNAT superfamily N-acetyltransferase
MSNVQIISLTENDLGTQQLFCGHSPTYRRGYNTKMEWLRDRLQEGMRYMLLMVNGRNAGMVEYMPGEAAWRGIDAKGYLVIHCFWVIGQNRGHGYGRKLLETCLEDAKGTNGVVVMVSKTHWLPTPKLFLKNGFQLADQSAPSFDLLVKRINPEVPLPRIKRSKQIVPTGLTLYHSDQCPYTQNVPEIVAQVGGQLKIPVNIIHVDSAKTAQELPSPYGTLAYFYNTELLTYHPTGMKKLLELLEPFLVG